MNDQVVELKNVNTIQQANNPLQMISVAVEKGQSVESLQMLMDLQERHEANIARKAYSFAMAEFAKNAPKITKDGHVNYTSKKGATDYRHVTLANAINVVLPVLSKYGLSHSWKTKQENGLVTVKCVISHEAGHSESTQLTCGADQSGGKNNIQAIGSTVTYLQRYTLFSILGLAAFEDDDAMNYSDNVSRKNNNKEYYPNDKFNENLPRWEESIRRGNKNPKILVGGLLQRLTFTDQQLKQLHLLQKIEPENNNAK